MAFETLLNCSRELTYCIMLLMLFVHDTKTSVLRYAQSETFPIPHFGSKPIVGVLCLDLKWDLLEILVTTNFFQVINRARMI